MTNLSREMVVFSMDIFRCKNNSKHGILLEKNLFCLSRPQITENLFGSCFSLESDH